MSVIDRLSGLFPNQSLLIILLPRLEVRDSSEIENILTKTNKLFQHANEDRDADPATKEAPHPVSGGLWGGRTASVYLRQRTDIGALEERQAGREKLFVNP